MRLAEPQNYSSGTISGTTAKGRKPVRGHDQAGALAAPACNRFPCSEFSRTLSGTLPETPCQSLQGLLLNFLVRCSATGLPRSPGCPRGFTFFAGFEDDDSPGRSSHSPDDDRSAMKVVLPLDA